MSRNFFKHKVHFFLFFKSIYSNINIATPVPFWSMFAWLGFSAFHCRPVLSFDPKWFIQDSISLDNVFLKIHSTFLCLLIREFNPLTFKIIPIRKYFLLSFRYLFSICYAFFVCLFLSSSNTVLFCVFN